MKQYKVWIHVEEIDEDRDHYVDVEPCYSSGCFETEAKARDHIENELMTTPIIDLENAKESHRQS